MVVGRSRLSTLSILVALSDGNVVANDRRKHQFAKRHERE